MGLRRLLEYRTIDGVAFACPVSRIFCFVTKQSIFLKFTLSHNDTIETYSSCTHMLESLQMATFVWDTELPDVKFAIPSFEVCAFDGQSGEHSLSTCSGLCAVCLHFFFLSFKSELPYLRVDRQGNRSILTIFVCAPQRCECA